MRRPELESHICPFDGLEFYAVDEASSAHVEEALEGFRHRKGTIRSASLRDYQVRDAEGSESWMQKRINSSIIYGAQFTGCGDTVGVAIQEIARDDPHL